MRYLQRKRVWGVSHDYIVATYNCNPPGLDGIGNEGFNVITTLNSGTEPTVLVISVFDEYYEAGIFYKKDVTYMYKITYPGLTLDANWNEIEDTPANVAILEATGITFHPTYPTINLMPT